MTRYFIGKVVGQSTDGKWLFVQSSDPHAPPAEWHFKVSKDMIDAVLVVA